MRWRTSSASTMPRAYRFVVPVLGVWLATWIVLSWAAIQDDSLIHLRYADNLYLHHFITYDGVHPNYGASSLLYVSLLAVLRGLTASPQLPRAVSSVVHVLLFTGMAVALGLRLPREAKVARVAGLVLLGLLVTPSAVRWLEDGMETGLVVAVVSVMAWMIHGIISRVAGTSRLRGLLLGLVAFVAVMLRTELLLLCGVGFLILLLEWCRANSRSFDSGVRDDVASTSAQDDTPILVNRAGVGERRRASSIWPVVAIGAAAAAAVALIFSTMHVLLPDTALAKSHGIGHWINPIHDTAVTLTGAFSFGLGMLAFWLLTLGLVAIQKRLTLSGVLANCFCPVVLALSSLRGQEIQGVRYFAWTFAFSILWNLLELARVPDAAAGLAGGTHARGAGGGSAVWLYVFAGLLVLELPLESVVMHRVLARRSDTMRVFESQRLEVLRAWRGVASDIGYIGYFTGAQICDLAGLVNGREAARLTSSERVDYCARTKPDFIFGNSSQIGPMAAAMPMDDWMVCGRYDFANVRTLDRHYLVVRPEIADEVCRASGSQPETLDTVFSVKP